MQSLGRIVRRSYSTKPPSEPIIKARTALPKHAAAARDASEPMAIQQRHQKLGPEFLPPPESDLTPFQYMSYMRALYKGDLELEGGRDLTEAEWLDRLNEKRTRIRGFRVVNAEGEKQKKVVGQKIYLPNILFRMVRNHTPKGQAYNPYEATFRIPQSITKMDIRSYLWTVYSVKTTYIRTANYISPLRRTRSGMRPVGAYRTYKRAVVGLVDPFYYPHDVADMDKKSRKEREEWLDKNFGFTAVARWRRLELIRSSKAGSNSSSWNFTGYVRRDQILKEVAKRKALAARELDKVEWEMVRKQKAGQQILSDRKRRSRTPSGSRALTVS
ncbi:hypothetical protein F5I97DRAFT_1808409 [Phlebopus sp. FC_14]|nr:hypothetical protein F5I97DRAFT_1808409 [Phlebopus sp. FC_14]